MSKKQEDAKSKAQARKDSTPNEHGKVGIDNFNNANYATDNKYGQDLSGITYKEGISEHFGGDGSIGGNDVKNMMKAGYSSDDIYNFSKKKGLNYNKHGREYLQKEGDYNIGKGSDQWGDVFGEKAKDPVEDKTPAEEFKNEKVAEVIETQKTTNVEGNNIGDNNKFYGGVNQGTQDFSVNISGGEDGQAMSNMQSASAYQALNENAYERSKAKFSASGRAQQAIDMAEDSTKVNSLLIIVTPQVR